MSWTVVVRETARRELRELPASTSLRIADKISLLTYGPFPANSKKLATLPDSYRLRVGDYRVVYQVRREEHVVYILRVRHRRDAYRGL